MPTYQYACTACDERLEAVQSFTDAPLTDCPACGGTLRKVFSAVGVVFKGSGFYKTDSRGKTSDGPKTDTKADSGSGDKAAASVGSNDKNSSSSSSKDGSSTSSTSASSTAPAAPASKSA